MIGRIVRCLAVSVGSTLLTAVVLVTLAVGLGVHAGLANVIAVLCAIGPSYVANRRWVWRRTDRSSYLREVAPFWTLGIAGLIASTVVVAWTASATESWSPGLRSMVLPFANLATFGALWIVQFVLLERVIFREDRGALGVVG
jgi:putative flippase GtrA